MIEKLSNGKDCEWLAHQLKDTLLFDWFEVMDNPLFKGIYRPDGSHYGNYTEKGDWQYIKKDDVTFYIKFCKGQFLRIQIDLAGNQEENIIVAAEKLIEALSTIEYNDQKIGLPLAIYQNNYCLTIEYAFQYVEETIKALQENKMFMNKDLYRLAFLRTCGNCHYTSVDLGALFGNGTLYCTSGRIGTEVADNDTCTKHQYQKGEEAKIKVLLKDFFK